MTHPTHPTRDSAPNGRPWRATIVAAAVALLVVAAGTIALAAARPGLPDPVAVHWGPDGADGFVSVAGVVWLAAASVLGCAALFLALSLAQHISGRHLVAGLSAGTTVFVAVVTYGSVLTQRGLADARDASVPGALIAAGAVLALLLGYAVSRLTAPPQAARGRTGSTGSTGSTASLPVDPPRVTAPAGARLSWVRPLPVQRLMVAVVVVAGLAPTVYLALTADPWLWVIPVLLLGLLLVLSTGTVVVDRQGVRVRSLGLVTLLRVSREEITTAGPDSVRALSQYGGWGWRLGRDGSRGLVLADGPALRIHRRDRPDVVVTVSDPDGAAAVLNTLVERGGHTSG